MKVWLRRVVLTVAPVLLAAAVCLADGKWLDAERVTNWNKPSAEVPRAAAGDATRLARCMARERPATTSGDRALRTAGWRLIGPLQVFGPLSVAMATSDWDSMCRPVMYQVFAFVGDAFAGTLSPELMTTRGDGAFGSLRLLSSTEFSAEFVRYGSNAPSDTSEMSYRIQSGPLVVPTGP